MKKTKLIDVKAPIVPSKELGGLKLHTHIKDYYELVKSFSWLDKHTLRDCSASLFSPFHVGYEMKDTLIMVFHILNGKLLKICALKNYKGPLLGKIKIGMPIEKALKIQPNLFYDEDGELYSIKGTPGVTLETDAYNKYIEVITIHVNELEDLRGNSEEWKEFEKGNW